MWAVTRRFEAYLAGATRVLDAMPYGEPFIGAPDDTWDTEATA